MEPRRRHIFQLTVGTPIDPSWPFVWHSDVDAYFRPEKGGVIASACDATVHPPREPVVDPAAEGALRAALARAFPGLAPLELAEARACLRTFSADERFRIGRDPEVEGFSWVAALGGHGMSTSYAAGRLGASAVLGETSAELARFAVRP